MPFDKASAARMGAIGGKKRAMIMWADKDPQDKRNVILKLKLSQKEIDMISQTAYYKAISRTELIVQAVQTVHDNI